jgi:hypothetical protein
MISARSYAPATNHWIMLFLMLHTCYLFHRSWTCYWVRYIFRKAESRCRVRGASHNGRWVEWTLDKLPHQPNYWYQNLQKVLPHRHSGGRWPLASTTKAQKMLESFALSINNRSVKRP